tara:strand:- start:225 stop:626 length:402 start_codon:yes stop_codon:yes gene_type:complete
MPAGQYSFTLEQGTTLDFTLEYLDSESVPVDLTDFTGRMHIREKKDSDNIICSLSTTLDADGTGLDFTPPSGSLGENFPATSGSIRVFISAASSSNFNFQKAFYDLEIVSGSTYPIVTRVVEGRIKLSKEVTK